MGWDGWDNILWNALIKKKLNNCSIPEDLTVVTWNNKKRISGLEAQLNKFQIPHVVLGKENSFWASNRIKPKTLLKHNFSTKYVLAMDAFDVMIIRDLSNIIDDFKNFNAKILFNATSTIWPEVEEHGKIEESLANYPFAFFNSGVFIGEIEYIKEVFSEIPYSKKEYPYSDQYLIRQEYHKRYPEIQIDWQCKIFQVSNVKNYDIFDFIELIYKKIHL
jgi:hypothetical protein